jgi:hypothetical protein
MWGKAVDEIKKVRWKAYHGTTRHLIEENVLIETAYSKSLWMSLKKTSTRWMIVLH